MHPEASAAYTGFGSWRVDLLASWASHGLKLLFALVFFPVLLPEVLVNMHGGELGIAIGLLGVGTPSTLPYLHRARDTLDLIPDLGEVAEKVRADGLLYLRNLAS